MDALTYASEQEYLKPIELNSNYTFIHGDITDINTVTNVFEEHQFDMVVHFAAESHVDNSINSPGQFIQTNINGTYNLLETARKCWIDKPFIKKRTF